MNLGWSHTQGTLHNLKKLHDSLCFTSPAKCAPTKWLHKSPWIVWNCRILLKDKELSCLNLIATVFCCGQIRWIALRVLIQTSHGFFCSVNHLSGGGVYANHDATHSPGLARKNKTENDSRLLKNSEGNRDDEWTFCRGRGADIALFLKKTRIGKIRKIFEEN